METAKKLSSGVEGAVSGDQHQQFATFFLGDATYGIEVMKVQEITRPMPMTRVPLAPPFVKGLINLRGQIATAICLRTLFQIPGAPPAEQMNMICRVNNLLLSFLVDRIGDVMDVPHDLFEPVPDNVNANIKGYMAGVYKIPESLLSVVEVEKIAKFLQDIGTTTTENRGN
jgi:purine-binding chemotaxis protein CheW